LHNIGKKTAKELKKRVYFVGKNVHCFLCQEGLEICFRRIKRGATKIPCDLSGYVARESKKLYHQ